MEKNYMNFAHKKKNNFVSFGYYYYPDKGFTKMFVMSGTFNIDELNNIHDMLCTEIDEQKKNDYYGWRHG